MSEMTLKRIVRVGKRSRAPLRSTELTARQLRMSLPPIAKCRAFSSCKDFLDVQSEGLRLGQLYFPLEKVVLGEEAGKAIMECILKTPRQEKYLHRDPEVSLLDQLAKFVDHKSFRKLGSLPHDWLNKSPLVVEDALVCRARPIDELNALWSSRL